MNNLVVRTDWDASLFVNLFRCRISDRGSTKWLDHKMSMCSYIEYDPFKHLQVDWPTWRYVHNKTDGTQ